jgi:hypothetical protein
MVNAYCRFGIFTTFIVKLFPQLFLIFASALSAGPLLAQGETQPITSEECNIESLNQVSFSEQPMQVNIEKPLILNGWFIDAVSRSTPTNAQMVFTQREKEISIKIRRRIFRPDVAKAKGSSAYLIAGFLVEVPGYTLENGLWNMALKYRKDNKEYLCVGKGLINVTSRANG